MNDNKPVQVSDWSQKWKLGLYLVGLFGAVFLGFALLRQLSDVNAKLDKASGKFGISLSEASLQNVTSTQVTCGTATTTLLAAQSGRTSFVAQNQGTSTAYLCRSAGLCSATSGIALYATSTSQRPFIQTDGYAGQYTCSAPNTANVNIWHSQ
jgi:cytochrome bd-type quinol oxidase subunit 2